MPECLVSRIGVTSYKPLRQNAATSKLALKVLMAKPAFAVMRTKNGLTVLSSGMELHYERDTEAKRMIEIRSSFAANIGVAEEMALRKAAWKLVSQIAQGARWEVRVGEADGKSAGSPRC